SINPITGLIRWTPTDEQGSGTYSITARATDHSGATDTKSFLVTVNDIAGNLLPVVIDGPVVNPATGNTYYLLSKATWADSEAKANLLGGHLTTISDAAENEWVSQTFGADRNLWTGLYQPVGSAEPAGGWTWISGVALDFAKWDVPE